ncbi:MAG: FlgD immunoglobulin-like domain containing protein [Candidatus Diapherotrites archaeon]
MNKSFLAVSFVLLLLFAFSAFAEANSSETPGWFDKFFEDTFSFFKEFFYGEESKEVGINGEEPEVQKKIIIRFESIKSFDPFNEEKIPLTVEVSKSLLAHEYSIKLLDLKGNTIKQLETKNIGVGTHGFLWDGKDFLGNLAEEGTYNIVFDVIENNEKAIVSIKIKEKFAGIPREILMQKFPWPESIEIIILEDEPIKIIKEEIVIPVQLEITNLSLPEKYFIKWSNAELDEAYYYLDMDYFLELVESKANRIIPNEEQEKIFTLLRTAPEKTNKSKKYILAQLSEKEKTELKKLINNEIILEREPHIMTLQVDFSSVEDWVSLPYSELEGKIIFDYSPWFGGTHSIPLKITVLNTKTKERKNVLETTNGSQGNMLKTIHTIFDGEENELEKTTTINSYESVFDELLGEFLTLKSNEIEQVINEKKYSDEKIEFNEKGREIKRETYYYESDNFGNEKIIKKETKTTNYNEEGEKIREITTVFDKDEKEIKKTLFSSNYETESASEIIIIEEFDEFGGTQLKEIEVEYKYVISLLEETQNFELVDRSLKLIERETKKITYENPTKEEIISAYPFIEEPENVLVRGEEKKIVITHFDLEDPEKEGEYFSYPKPDKETINETEYSANGSIKTFTVNSIIGGSAYQQSKTITTTEALNRKTITEQFDSYDKLISKTVVENKFNKDGFLTESNTKYFKYFDEFEKLMTEEIVKTHYYEWNKSKERTITKDFIQKTVIEVESIFDENENLIKKTQAKYVNQKFLLSENIFYLPIKRITKTKEFNEFGLTTEEEILFEIWNIELEDLFLEKTLKIESEYKDNTLFKQTKTLIDSDGVIIDETELVTSNLIKTRHSNETNLTTYKRNELVDITLNTMNKVILTDSQGNGTEKITTTEIYGYNIGFSELEFASIN